MTFCSVCVPQAQAPGSMRSMTFCSVCVSQAQARGVSDSVIGFVFSCYALTQLVMTPVASKLVSR